MENKVRKQIYLEPQQNELLKQVSERMGVSEAEVIRQALDGHARRVRIPLRRMTAWEREKAFIQSWIDQGAVPGGRTWKREDLYER